METKKGICPEDSNQVEWLALFKAGILDSLKEKDERLKLKIQGFASIAPVPVNGIINDRQSDTLNCEIANQRAEALIYFLMLPDSTSYDPKECAKALKDSSMWGRKENELCTRSAIPDINAWKERGFDVTYEMRPDTTIVWKGPKFDVAYKPWPSYDEMYSKKPLQNPAKNLQNSTQTVWIEDRQLQTDEFNSTDLGMPDQTVEDRVMTGPDRQINYSRLRIPISCRSNTN